eukprot:1083870_1
MAQQMETGASGEGCTESMPIKKWMEKNGKPLSDQTIQILQAQCITTIKDLSEITEQEMREYGKELKIPIGDRSKLTSAIRQLTKTKKQVIYLTTDEITRMQSIELEIKQFHDTLNGVIAKEKTIEEQREQLETEINAQFQAIMNQLNERKLALIATLNTITNKKKDLIKTKVIKYTESLHQMQNIKENNDEMMDKPIELHQLTERQQKVQQNAANISTIITDTNHTNGTAISERILCTIDVDSVLKVINALGMISDTDVPILHELKQNNSGVIQIFWKISRNDDVKCDDQDTKICIEYSLVNEENNWTQKEFDVESKSNEGDESVRVNKIGVYRCRLKYCAKSAANKLWSPYSNVKSININKLGPHVLKWNTKEGTHGNAERVTFVNANTVACFWSVVCVDYVIKAQDVNVFCYEFQLIDHDGANVNSTFGFAPYPLNKEITDVNRSFHIQSYGVRFLPENYHVYVKGSKQKEQALPNGEKFKKTDKIGFRINMENKTAELFYNRNNLGVVYQNIPKCIIPVMSGTGYDGKSTCSVISTTY